LGRHRYDVLGVWVDATDPAGAMAHVKMWLARRERQYVCFANVHSVMEAHRDPSLRAIYNAAGLTVPDGMPLVWAARARGRRGVRRVYGPDFMLQLCDEAARGGWSCYFYGGRPGVAARLEEQLVRRFPGLRSAGTYAPPFGSLSTEEAREAVARINRARPDIVFVGLGCPKQERWMAAHRAQLDAPLLAGVGAAFDFAAGRVRQAPRWMMRAGLEWLFRLLQEPGRLWYRYLVYNPLFVAHFLLQTVGVRRYGPEEPPSAT
jgi:N-acetylglucosaminyldiphosphoundecaprenol N-acetyl-beta-D-mannosaminyltransferase